MTSNAIPATDSLLARLETEARAVLDASWLGASTLPSRTLYPHQWNWDSAFIAIGRSWYDQARAEQELRSLFAAQWANGKVPSIVFNPSVGEDAYFPGPAFWQTSKRSAGRAAGRRDVRHHPARHPRPRGARDASARARRGGVPGVPALDLSAARRRARLHDRSPGPGRHRSAGRRAPMGIRPGQLAGLGPRPQRDGDPAGAVPPYVRHDLAHGDPKDRPTNAAYDQFVYLAASYRDSGYDDARIARDRALRHGQPAVHVDPPVVDPRAGRDRRPSSARTPRRIGRQRRASMTAMLSELWDPERAAVQRTRRDPPRAERGGHRRIARPTARPGAPAGTGRGDRRGPALRELPSRGADQLRRPELRPPRRELRRAALLARPRLDQHELAAGGRPPPARLSLAGRADREQQCPPHRGCRVPRVLQSVRRHGVWDGRLRLERGVDDRLHRAPASIGARSSSKNGYALRRLDQAESPPHRPMPVGAGAGPLRA